MHDETFTREELEAALGRVKIYSDSEGIAWAGHNYGKAAYPDALAVDVLRDIKHHREPEYEGGKFYMDAGGDVYEYDSDDRKWWMAGDTWARAFDTPVRPLRKMEPVG